MDHPAAPPRLAAPLARPTWPQTRVQPWLGVACALTLLDAAATALWLRLGLAVEANPLLADLVEVVGAAPAMAVRGAVGVGLLVVLAALRERSVLARLALPAVTAVLAAVAVWHGVGALLLV